MTAMIVPARPDDWQRLKNLVLYSVSSRHTGRIYNMALDEFILWYRHQPNPHFNKAVVSAWRSSLEVRGLGSSFDQCSALSNSKVSREASDSGLLAPGLGAGVLRVRGVKSTGICAGNWLSLHQAQAVLNAPDVMTLKGLRDRAMLAVLFGCGLRRSEVAALTTGRHVHRGGRLLMMSVLHRHLTHL